MLGEWWWWGHLREEALTTPKGITEDATSKIGLEGRPRVH